MNRIAIVGAGAIAPKHVEAYLEFANRCKITYVCDGALDKASSLANRFKLRAEVVRDYHELLTKSDIDLVSICTPPSTHAQIAIDFLTHGKHVLVEKPMASSLTECDAMLEAAHKSGKILSVVAQNRFRTPWMKLKALLDMKVAGEILHTQINSYWWRGHCYYDLSWRGTWESEGGGCTLNHAVHHIDALQWMMGMPSEVHALMSNVAHDNAEVEDISMAILRFPSGGVGQITSSVVHHGQEQQLIFQCEHARLSAPWSLYASRSMLNGFPERDVEREEAIQRLYDQLPDLRYQEHVGQIDDVLRAIELGTPVLVNGYDGRRTLELIMAIYKSASTGQTVKLPLDAVDSFYNKESLLQGVPRFNKKTTFVERFASNDITTGQS
ncbi:oxidoreductase [Alicyclobacillus hesperidum subsp. aegles]|uniref:Gfo/Idh/MocA family protein n=1 Tax=Alicyclobacillus hesperidum TaxID=89784 RepID=UPI00222B0024|nr:Gfo/Idh/MocA family oxidoreductase [Alicyclobacillus hesperidum]GLG00080.1 oxidoreductase [Alicyclobacillus hesperidum subsp. aegles]